MQKLKRSRVYWGAKPGLKPWYSVSIFARGENCILQQFCFDTCKEAFAFVRCYLQSARPGRLVHVSYAAMY